MTQHSMEGRGRLLRVLPRAVIFRRESEGELVRRSGRTPEPGRVPITPLGLGDVLGGVCAAFWAVRVVRAAARHGGQRSPGTGASP